MFSSKERLESRTPADGVGRLEFLQQLVTEFQTTIDDAKEQVLANLANFAYDPINYEFFRELNVIDLFLDMLTESNTKLVEFGIGGLCNLVLDKVNKDYILNCGGVKLIIEVLSRPEEEIILSAITTLMFLMTPQSKTEITAPSIVKCMHRFAQSESRRLSNLANVFLQDYCTAEQRQAACVDSPQMSTVVGIPLPSKPNTSSSGT